MKKILLAILSLVAFIAIPSQAQNTTVLFDFSSTSDQSGQFGGTLEDGAQLTRYADTDILELGSEGGWFQFDGQLAEFLARLKSCVLYAALGEAVDG